MTTTEAVTVSVDQSTFGWDVLVSVAAGIDRPVADGRFCVVRSVSRITFYGDCAEQQAREAARQLEASLRWLNKTTLVWMPPTVKPPYHRPVLVALKPASPGIASEAPACDRPWVGYLLRGSDSWRAMDGTPIRVRAWAERPTPNGGAS